MPSTSRPTGRREGRRPPPSSSATTAAASSVVSVDGRRRRPAAASVDGATVASAGKAAGQLPDVADGAGGASGTPPHPTRMPRAPARSSARNRGSAVHRDIEQARPSGGDTSRRRVSWAQRVGRCPQLVADLGQQLVVGRAGDRARSALKLLYALITRNRKKATTTKLMTASITRPIEMRASPMSKPISCEVRLAEDRRDDRVDHAVEDGVDDLLEVQRHHQADGDGDHVALVDEVLEFLE